MTQHVEDLARISIDCGLEIHRALGPGLLESVYEVVLAHSLGQRGLAVERQKAIDFRFGDILFTEGFRADLVVGERLILELKSVERFSPVHAKQLLTYLRLANQPLGLLMNFGCETFREGLRRVVNNHTDISSSALRLHAPAPT